MYLCEWCYHIVKRMKWADIHASASENLRSYGGTYCIIPQHIYTQGPELTSKFFPQVFYTY